MTSDLRVAVVGGGLGGLTLGIALRQYGIDALVFERTPELREIGAAVGLAGNGTRLLERVGLAAGLAAVSTVPTELVYRHWRDGRILVRHSIGLGNAYFERFGAPFYGLHRSDFQQLLSATFGPAGLRLGHDVVGLRETSDGISLEFADGGEFDADIVVGADGVRSTVRPWVTDEGPPAYTGCSGFRGLAPVSALPSLPDPLALQFWVGPDVHLLHYAIAGGQLINFLAVSEGPEQWPTSDSTLPSEPGELAAMFDGWHPAVLEIISAVPQSPRWALFSQPPLTRWSRGRAVLLGDAAHTMLPHQGQGANQAIEDAFVLAECLATERDHTTAFARYQRRRRARTRLIQTSSLATSVLLHLPDGPAADARDADLAGFPDRFDWIHSHDACPSTVGA